MATRRWAGSGPQRAWGGGAEIVIDGARATDEVSRAFDRFYDEVFDCVEEAILAVLGPCGLAQRLVELVMVRLTLSWADGASRDQLARALRREIEHELQSAHEEPPWPSPEAG